MLRVYIQQLLYDVPVLAWRIGGGFLGACVTYIRIVWFLFSRKAIRRGKPFTLSISTPLLRYTHVLHNPVDIASLVELYVGNEYAHVPETVTYRTIIDLGANYGDSALYFHARYPKAHIHAIEAAPSSFAYLQKNCEPYKAYVTTYHALVGDTNDIGTLYLDQNNTLGNSVHKRSGTTSVTLPVLTLDDLYTKIGTVDLIKFDIEGAEETVFRNRELSTYARAYIGEVHEDLMNITLEAFCEYFKGFHITLHPLQNPKRHIFYAEVIL